MATTTSSAAPTPALPPPPGRASNFNDPATLNGAMNIAIGVTIPLTTICFLLRTYVRIWIKEQKWICEDWFTLAAFIGTIAFCGTGAATTAHHGGEHEWDITPSQAKEAYYWLNVGKIVYTITICTAKLAILCLYRRVLRIYPRSAFDIIAILLIIVLTLFYVATTIVKIWECVPRARAWDNSIPGNCIDTPMLLNVGGVFNLLTDLIMVMMPLLVVWNVNMEITRKVHIVLAVTFGMCAPAFSLVGLTVRLRNHRNKSIFMHIYQPLCCRLLIWAGRMTDVLLVPRYIQSLTHGIRLTRLAELTTAILCVSFPELRVLLNGSMRRPRKQASTGIREGRYRDQGAVFNDVRHSPWSLTTSLRVTLATVDTSYVEEAGGCNGASKTTISSADDDGGCGGRHEHVERVEVELEIINRRMTALIVENGQLVKHTPMGSPGEVEIAREIGVDSNMV